MKVILDKTPFILDEYILLFDELKICLINESK